MSAAGHGLVGVPDAGAFLARLTHIDPAALVRLRPVPDPPDGVARTALWARLPWQALVTRVVRGGGVDEATVAAADLLAVLTSRGDYLPARRDADWRWSLPPDTGRVVETVGAAELANIARAAAGTLRSAVATRRVGERVVRDALLDHIAIVVTAEDPAGSASGAAGRDAGSVSGAAAHGVGPVEVPQRLVQAVVRMGFLGAVGDTAGETVQVRLAGKWTGLAAPYGTAWIRPVNEFSIHPLRTSTNG